jgi:hypothetical protein
MEDGSEPACLVLDLRNENVEHVPFTVEDIPEGIYIEHLPAEYLEKYKKEDYQ